MAKAAAGGGAKHAAMLRLRRAKVADEVAGGFNGFGLFGHG